MVYAWTTGFTLVAALFDFVKALPAGMPGAAIRAQIVSVGELLPLFDIGLGWVCPAAVGLIIGLICSRIFRVKTETLAE